MLVAQVSQSVRTGLCPQSGLSPTVFPHTVIVNTTKVARARASGEMGTGHVRHICSQHLSVHIIAVVREGGRRGEDILLVMS